MPLLVTLSLADATVISLLLKELLLLLTGFVVVYSIFYSLRVNLAVKNVTLKRTIHVLVPDSGLPMLCF